MISWNIHTSGPEKDVENDRKQGKPDYDRLFHLKPLLDTHSTGLQSILPPPKNLSIDERMVATKAHTGMMQYMKAKPTKWGFKLFVLAGSSSGCTFDFSVYTGQFPSGVGLAYDSVMSLIKPASFVFGQFLHQSKILQGSVSHENWSMWNIPRKQKRLSPHTVKCTPKKDPRGSARWIRDDPLVQARKRESCLLYDLPGILWKHCKEESENSHKSIPCPTPVLEYNKHVGGI